MQADAKTLRDRNGDREFLGLGWPGWQPGIRAMSSKGLTHFGCKRNWVQLRIPWRFHHLHARLPLADTSAQRTQRTYGLTTACPGKHNFRPQSLRHLNLLYADNRKPRRMRMRENSFGSLRFAVAVLFLSSFAAAQAVSGKIAGYVSDPSGAAVPNATVTVTDLDRVNQVPNCDQRNGQLPGNTSSGRPLQNQDRRSWLRALRNLRRGSRGRFHRSFISVIFLWVPQIGCPRPRAQM